jgi:hypothetical protein
MWIKSSLDNDGVCFVLDQRAELEVCIVLAHWNNSPWVDMPHQKDTLRVVYVGQKLTRWWLCLLCTGPTRWVGGLYSPSSLKQQSVSRHAHHKDTLRVVYVGQKLTRWWWCLLCTGPTRWVGGLYSPSSLKQQSVSRHAAPHGHIVCCVCRSKAHEMMMVSALYWTNTMSWRFIQS